jgi:YtcA family
MHCPSLNIFGTFFPAWMLCAVIGIVGAALAFKLFTSRHIAVGPPLLVYPSIALAVTSLAWLGWYGH